MNAAALAVMAIAAIGAAGAYTQKSLATTVGQRVMHDLRGTLYHHLQQQPLPFFDSRRTGDLMVRLTSDVDATQEFFSSALLSATMDVLTLAGMVAIMLYLDWRFALLALAVAPLLFSWCLAARGASSRRPARSSSTRAPWRRWCRSRCRPSGPCGRSHARTTRKPASIARAAPPCTPRCRRAA